MSQLCLGCMCEINGEQKCPHCGFDKDSVQSAPFLPLGTILQERYLVGKQIDNSVEGAYYIGYDNFMHSAIVIHEFLPSGICGRAPGNVDLVIREGSEQTFETLKKSFLEYYRTLARLRELSSITLRKSLIALHLVNISKEAVVLSTGILQDQCLCLFFLLLLQFTRQELLTLALIQKALL